MDEQYIENFGTRAPLEEFFYLSQKKAAKLTDVPFYPLPLCFNLEDYPLDECPTEEDLCVGVLEDLSSLLEIEEEDKRICAIVMVESNRFQFFIDFFEKQFSEYESWDVDIVKLANDKEVLPKNLHYLPGKVYEWTTTIWPIYLYPYQAFIDDCIYTRPECRMRHFLDDDRVNIQKTKIKKQRVKIIPEIRALKLHGNR